MLLLDVSTMQRSVLLLDVSTLQRPVLLQDVHCKLQRSVVHLVVSGLSTEERRGEGKQRELLHVSLTSEKTEKANHGLQSIKKIVVGPELYLDLSEQQEPVLLIEVSTSQVPELHMDVCKQQEPVLLLDFSTSQGPGQILSCLFADQITEIVPDWLAAGGENMG